MNSKRLKGGEIKFINQEELAETSWTIFDEMFMPAPTCEGRHCAVHRPFNHVITNRVRKTNKTFKTRIPCKGAGCQICEALHE